MLLLSKTYTAQVQEIVDKIRKNNPHCVRIYNCAQSQTFTIQGFHPALGVQGPSYTTSNFNRVTDIRDEFLSLGYSIKYG